MGAAQLVRFPGDLRLRQLLGNVERGAQQGEHVCRGFLVERTHKVALLSSQIVRVPYQWEALVETGELVRIANDVLGPAAWQVEEMTYKSGSPATGGLY